MKGRMKSLDLPTIGNWMVKKSLRSSRSSNLERLEDERKAPYKSKSLSQIITVSRGFFIFKRRHNSLVHLAPIVHVEYNKPKHQNRFFINSSKKPSYFLQQKPRVMIQGKLIRSKRIDGFRL